MDFAIAGKPNALPSRLGNDGERARNLNRGEGSPGKLIMYKNAAKGNKPRRRGRARPWKEWGEIAGMLKAIVSLVATFIHLR